MRCLPRAQHGVLEPRNCVSGRGPVGSGLERRTRGVASGDHRHRGAYSLPCRGTEKSLGRVELRCAELLGLVNTVLASALQTAGKRGTFGERCDRIIEMRGFFVGDAKQVVIDRVRGGVELYGLFKIWNSFRI